MFKYSFQNQFTRISFHLFQFPGELTLSSLILSVKIEEILDRDEIIKDENF